MMFPKILKAFVDINKIALYDTLEKIGIDYACAEKIISDSYPPDFCVNRAYSVAASTFYNLERLKVYNIPEVKKEFVNEGFFKVN